MSNDSDKPLANTGTDDKWEVCRSGAPHRF